MAENFPNLMRDVSINTEETQQIESKMNSKRPTSRHTVFKLSKGKGKEAKQRWIITYKGSSIRISADFSSEDLEARKQWANLFNTRKEKLSSENLISS